MPLSWNEIRSRAVDFSKEWKDESSEDAEAKSFWDAFFNVFGIRRRKVATFEQPVKKSDGKGGFIDLLWKGVLVVEHKSLGKDLDRAFVQAKEYFSGLKDRDLPRYVLVSDFQRFRLYDLDEDQQHEFTLRDLHKNVRLFGFVAGYETRFFGESDPVNIQAAEKLGKLHDLLKAVGYEGHQLEVFLVRILFCLFAEDNSIFEPQQFRELLELRSAEDGSDLAALLASLFQVLNTPPAKRLKNLDEQLAEFPYINGRLFAEQLPMAAFDKKMRNMLLECTTLKWSRISPAIFGALFQSIMDKKARRNLGAHYTSEVNILKALNPLFLDGLRAEFERIRRDKRRLVEFHRRLAQINVLDPACGCGNFLVIAYRELRLIELEVLRELQKGGGQQVLDVGQIIWVDVDQFYGIEVEEFPAQIAQVALWLMDHQMNMQVSEEFGQYFVRLPLNKAPSIVHANALRIDWASVVRPADLTYIVGNPPFVGHQNRKPHQAEDHTLVWGTDGSFGRLDYVTCWYRKAVDYMRENTQLACAFVSTNSICQGEQVGTLWAFLLGAGVVPFFAHRTFRWSAEGRGAAAVHCVIVGFALTDRSPKQLFEYETVEAEPHVIPVNRINPYLVDAPDVLLPARPPTPVGLPVMTKGSQPTDGGHLILNSDEERDELLKACPGARKWIRRYVGADELLYDLPRYCLWLKGITAAELNAMPEVKARVRAVAKTRAESPTESVQGYPAMEFTQDRQPTTRYLAVPAHTSEHRRFIPMAYLEPKVIASNALRICAGATLYHFGILHSTMHQAWIRHVCGRLESRYRYEPAVYNNFPWPQDVTDRQREAVERCAQAVLDARTPGSSLADLYDTDAMSADLLRAHQALDRAADACYGRRSFATESERVAFLFNLYVARRDALAIEAPAPARKRTAAKKAPARKRVAV
ncbi:class I SAM-dependent DNA methyltransferase [Ideonella dechloratans]|uniref:class I SAM-dependent DNA methyltransferase n=1 Tax=Ideonella dechloratans TaxID=36863 RepID=UPI0035B1FB0A